MRIPSIALVAATMVALTAPSALGQDQANLEPSVWVLTLGFHASELPTDKFVGYACGTNGGPPSLPIKDWTEYSRCPAEAETGWHEVYFQFDDERKYLALALHDDVRAAVYAYTSVYSQPVIAAALFDDDGFMRGLRVVTDPRVDVATRELAYTLGGYLQARYDGDWDCEQLPRVEGETAYRGIYIKKVCTLVDTEDGVSRRIETHLFRRPGQTALNPDNLPTEGYFESSTRFEEFLIGEIENREERLAEIAARPPPAPDPLLEQARDCPGCDLSGVVLKRVDLSGANLAGANLAGATFHASNLSGANLEGANLEGANLNRALLTRANLTGANLTGATLYEARLDGADLTEATMVTVFAGHSRMISANLTGAVISDSDLTAALMTNVTAVETSFARSRLWNAQLSRSDFTDAVFARADMLEVVMTSAIATGADFRISNLYGADLRDSDFAGADFSGAVMTGAIVARNTFEGAVFEGATLPGGFVPP